VITKSSLTPSEAVLIAVESVNRLGYTVDEIADELTSFAKLGCDWPRATRNQWIAEIEKAVAGGRLRMDQNRIVTLPVAAAQLRQLELL
jgi:hypothetical protein